MTAQYRERLLREELQVGVAALFRLALVELDALAMRLGELRDDGVVEVGARQPANLLDLDLLVLLRSR